MTSGRWSGKSATNRKEELPANWAQLREAQLIRDGRRCTRHLPSGKRCPNAATDVDHYGSKWDHSRLRSLCSLHHAKRTAKQGGDGNKPKRPPRRGGPHPGRA